jgi:hypothetical protein
MPATLCLLVLVAVPEGAEFFEWHEAMVNSTIDFFEMSYEVSVSYFKRLEKMEKITRSNGPSFFTTSR